jgi:hypothetical protein
METPSKQQTSLTKQRSGRCPLQLRILRLLPEGSSRSTILERVRLNRIYPDTNSSYFTSWLFPHDNRLYERTRNPVPVWQSYEVTPRMCRGSKESISREFKTLPDKIRSQDVALAEPVLRILALKRRGVCSTALDQKYGTYESWTLYLSSLQLALWQAPVYTLPWGDCCLSLLSSKHRM